MLHFKEHNHLIFASCCDPLNFRPLCLIKNQDRDVPRHMPYGVQNPSQRILSEFIRSLAGDRFGCASFIRQWWSSLICSVFAQIRPNECHPDSQMAYGSSLSRRRIIAALSSDRDSGWGRGGLLKPSLSPNPGNAQYSQI